MRNTGSNPVGGTKCLSDGTGIHESLKNFWSVTMRVRIPPQAPNKINMSLYFIKDINIFRYIQQLLKSFGWIINI